MGAAKTLCTAFGELLTATEPNSTQPRQTMLSAASQVGSASHRVLYTIGEEEVADKDRQDVLLGLAKAVANTTAALVLKAKNVASKCPDQTTQNKVSFLIKKNRCCKLKNMVSTEETICIELDLGKSRDFIILLCAASGY